MFEKENFAQLNDFGFSDISSQSVIHFLFILFACFRIVVRQRSPSGSYVMLSILFMLYIFYVCVLCVTEVVKVFEMVKEKLGDIRSIWGCYEQNGWTFWRMRKKSLKRERIINLRPYGKLFFFFSVLLFIPLMSRCTWFRWGVLCYYRPLNYCRHVCGQHACSRTHVLLLRSAPWQVCLVHELVEFILKQHKPFE